MPAERRRTVAERFDAFKKAVEEGTPTEPLVLNSDDLNALIEDRTDFKGKIYATIEKDKLKGEVSIPLDEIPSFGLTRGRYLNGQAELKVSLEGGLLLVTIDSFEINGKQLPSQFMEGVRQQNLAKEIYKDVKNVEKIRKLESIVIKDGQIIIKAKDRQKDKHGVKPADAPPEETKPGKADRTHPTSLQRRPSRPAIRPRRPRSPRRRNCRRSSPRHRYRPSRPRSPELPIGSSLPTCAAGLPRGDLFLVDSCVRNDDEDEFPPTRIGPARGDGRGPAVVASTARAGARRRSRRSRGSPSTAWRMASACCCSPIRRDRKSR